MYDMCAEYLEMTYRINRRIFITEILKPSNPVRTFLEIVLCQYATSNYIKITPRVCWAFKTKKITGFFNLCFFLLFRKSLLWISYYKHLWTSLIRSIRIQARSTCRHIGFVLVPNVYLNRNTNNNNIVNSFVYCFSCSMWSEYTM